MEVSFALLKEKEIINVLDGRKLGRVIDVVFDNANGIVLGIVVPGERKLFKKNEDVFIPLNKIKRIGDDVVLVSLDIAKFNSFMPSQNVYQSQNLYNPQIEPRVSYNNGKKSVYSYEKPYQKQSTNNSFVRYRRIDNKKYK